MATTDINGLVYYETTDPVTPLQNVLNAMTTSVTNALDATDRIFYVADQTARDNLLTARGAPLTVAREDTEVWERTTDGTTWNTVYWPHDLSSVSVTAATGFTLTGNTLFTRSGWLFGTVSLSKNSGTLAHGDTLMNLPSNIQPIFTPVSVTGSAGPPAAQGIFIQVATTLTVIAPPTGRTSTVVSCMWPIAI